MKSLPSSTNSHGLLPGRACLALFACFILLPWLSSCNELKKIQLEMDAKADALKQAQKLKEEVISQIEIPKTSWSWDARPLSESARESTWNKLLGNTHMLEASFTLHNKSSLVAKDFVVTIAVSANSGTVVREISTSTLYERLAPGESKSFPRQIVGAIPVGEGTATIRVTGLEIVP